MYFVYVLGCEDSSLYCGYTTDVKRRVHAHFYRLAECAKYTKSHAVVSVEAVWESASPEGARKLEYRFKQLSREKKLLLISSPESIYEIIPSVAEYDFRFRGDIKLDYCIGNFP